MLMFAKTAIYIIILALGTIAFFRFRDTEKPFWIAILSIIIALTISDFFLASIGAQVRDHLKALGVYGERGEVQFELILAAFVFVTVSILLFSRFIPKKKGSKRLIVWLGLLVIASALQAISQHDVDTFFNMPIFGMLRMRHLIFTVLQLLVAAEIGYRLLRNPVQANASDLSLGAPLPLPKPIPQALTKEERMQESFAAVTRQAPLEPPQNAEPAPRPVSLPKIEPAVPLPERLPSVSPTSFTDPAPLREFFHNEEPSVEQDDSEEPQDDNTFRTF